ncbi:MAG TPA: BTAD domain-containing putative transcriptional regulator [Micromonosporaceae bacterium]|nr:BTAD domain-containing putative transcriptional regulator [Micromonosporaceae bacterium]
MRFGILGPTQVWFADGRELTLGGARLRALLALLLADVGRVVPTESLIDGVYGGQPPIGAPNALQSQVSRLRRALITGDAATDAGRYGVAVEFHPAGYRLVVDPDRVDACRFTALAAAGRGALAAADPASAADLLREALDLWRGAALAEVLEVPAGRVAAARLEESRLTAVEDRAAAELALGRHAPLVAELRELVAVHPLRERLRARLMHALYADGRPAEALAVYTDARRTLADELGVDPSAELAAVHLAILRADPVPDPLPGRPAAGPSPGSGLPGTGRLRHDAVPAQLTTFVGRGEELVRVEQLLGSTRLVTLTGPGGAGKTRLAAEAAARHGGEVAFVELAPLVDGADIPRAVLGALGLREAGLRPGPDRMPRPPDPVGRLVAALNGHRLLLVLDNCEHVVAAVATFADRLLRACPTLQILATSREALGITGESLCPVPPLALPPPGATLAEAMAFPAVRLFVDRATAVRPDFTLDASTVSDVGRVCRALDGLPLAIELAAARLRSLTPAEVAARLDDRFALLSRGSRASAPRHRTLRAVVDWSWDLLAEEERGLARRLTVFAGGATLAAIERVCGLPPATVVDVLTGLVEKSLVDVADGRYRMSETVRAYAAERLAEAGEEERLRAAHAAYFLGVASTADPYLRGHEQVDWLRRLDADRDNLHAAVRRATAAGDTATALRLVANLSGYWWLRGLRSEGAALAGLVLDRLPGEPSPELLDEYAMCLLDTTAGSSSTAPLQARVEQARNIVYALRRPARYPFLNVLHGMTMGPPPEDALDRMMVHQLGEDPWLRALARYGLGAIELYSGRLAEGDTELSAALAGFRAVGDRWGMANTLADLASLAEWRGDRAGFLAMIDEALSLAAQLDSTDDIVELMCRRGRSSAAAGDLASAQADFAHAAHLARRGATREALAMATLGLADVARLGGDLDGARELADAALLDCPTGWFGPDLLRLRILTALGWIAEAAGDAPTARAWHEQALAAAEGGRFGAAAPVAEGLAGVALLEGDALQAALLLGAAGTLRRETGTGDCDGARVAARARAVLGDAAYDAVYARGAALADGEVAALLSAGPSASGA